MLCSTNILECYAKFEVDKVATVQHLISRIEKITLAFKSKMFRLLSFTPSHTTKQEFNAYGVKQ
jgi:hypothetical protein